MNLAKVYEETGNKIMLVSLPAKYSKKLLDTFGKFFEKFLLFGRQ